MQELSKLSPIFLVNSIRGDRRHRKANVIASPGEARRSNPDPEKRAPVVTAIATEPKQSPLRSPAKHGRWPAPIFLPQCCNSAARRVFFTMTLAFSLSTEMRPMTSTPSHPLAPGASRTTVIPAENSNATIPGGDTNTLLGFRSPLVMQPACAILFQGLPPIKKHVN